MIVDFGHNRISPCARDVVFKGEKLAERILEDQLREEAADACNRIGDGERDRGACGVDIRKDQQMEIFRLLLCIDGAVHDHSRASADERESLDVHEAVVNVRFALNRREVKAGRVEVAEIKRQITRQRLKREQREQFGRGARLDL